MTRRGFCTLTASKRHLVFWKFESHMATTKKQATELYCERKKKERKAERISGTENVTWKREGKQKNQIPLTKENASHRNLLARVSITPSFYLTRHVK